MAFITERVCSFDGCGVRYFGEDSKKFCDEHRKDKYRYLRASKPKAQVNDANITIKHKSSNIFTLYRECDCCGDVYSIELYPHQFIYPRYCEGHRNLYKRSIFKKDEA